MDSDTYSTSGPATIRNAGRSTFVVRKLMVLGPHGLSVWPAVLGSGQQQLPGLSGYEFRRRAAGGLARAQHRHEPARGSARGARVEVQQKVAIKASAPARR